MATAAAAATERCASMVCPWGTSAHSMRGGGFSRVAATPPASLLRRQPHSSDCALRPMVRRIVDRRLVCRGVGRRWRSRRSLRVANSSSSSSSAAEAGEPRPKTVLVVGATGGVGQLLVASLLEKGVKVRALLRNAEKAKTLFRDKLGEQLEVRIGDTRQPELLDGPLFEVGDSKSLCPFAYEFGITHVINATGTTAYPTLRWRGDNGPKQTDWIGVRNLVDALPRTVQRMVLVSAIGVSKYDEFPWTILNLFGILKYKKMGEDYLRASGIPYTVIRAGQLVDGPYTSYDLQTLLKATSGTRRGVILGQGDKLVGDASRVVVAEACVHALDLDAAKGQTYEVTSVEGEGPGRDAEKWASIFQAVNAGV